LIARHLASKTNVGKISLEGFVLQIFKLRTTTKDDEGNVKLVKATPRSQHGTHSFLWRKPPYEQDIFPPVAGMRTRIGMYEIGLYKDLLRW